jgi:hypothetical protein
MNLIKHILESITDHRLRRNWAINAVRGIEEIANKYGLKRVHDAHLCWIKGVFRIRLSLGYTTDMELSRSMDDRDYKHLAVHMPNDISFTVEDMHRAYLDSMIVFPDDPSHMLRIIDRTLASNLKEAVDDDDPRAKKHEYDLLRSDRPQSWKNVAIWWKTECEKICKKHHLRPFEEKDKPRMHDIEKHWDWVGSVGDTGDRITGDRERGYKGRRLHFAWTGETPQHYALDVRLWVPLHIETGEGEFQWEFYGADDKISGVTPHDLDATLTREIAKIDKKYGG